MARRVTYRGPVVIMPAELTPQMRRAWLSVDIWCSDEQQDAIWKALKRFAVPSKGDGPDHA
jgi:hypothetical protein